MANINKAAVLNPFTDLTANILDYVPRATTSEFGIVAIGSGINVDGLGRIYLDTQEYSDRLTAIEAQAASSLATQKSEVAAAIAQANLTQSQAITALTLEVSNLKTNLTNSITATQTDLINRADQLAQDVTDITVQLTQDKSTFTQDIQDALVYLQNEVEVKTKVLPATSITTASAQNQQQINDFGGAKWYAKVGGYELGATVKLDSGDIVKSTVPNNINDPNLDMTGWKFESSTITPFHFGAIGDGQSHKLSERHSTLVEAQSVYPIATSLNDEIDWCALQSMLDYALSQGFNRKTTIDWSGNFHLNKGIKYLAPTDESGAWRSINGDLRFTVRDDFDQSYEAVISLAGRGINHQGVIEGSCRNIVRYGVVTVPRSEPTRIDFGIKLDRIYINHARIYGVAMFQGSMFGTLNLYRGAGCGVSGIYAGKKLESNFNSKTDTYVNQLSSYSTLNVDVLPPYPTSETPTFVKIGDFLSKVSEIDTNAKTLKIEPHIPSNATGILDYIYGGGVFIEGSNTASVTVGGISAIGCGIGLYHANMYPTTVDNFASEYSGIAMVEAGLVAGANILTHYFEGDWFQYVNMNGSSETYGSTTFQHGTAFDFNKVAYLPFRANPDGTHYATLAGARGLSVRTSKYLHKLESGKNPNNYFSSCVIDFNTPHTLLSYKGDVATVTFAGISPDSNRLFGYDTQDIQFFGTAQNGAPQQITFTVLAGYKLNGGTTNLVFNTFSAAAKFSCFLDVNNKNIIVSAITESGKSYSVSGLYPYSSLDSTNDVGYWYISDYTQISSVPTPTATTSRCAFKQYYVYGDRANGTFTMVKEVFFMDINETWVRTFNKTTGVLSAWLLKSYQTRKGATAQRPNNPQLGMRYYDTTLLATGKPIEWNGSSWIDMAGVVV